MDAKSMRTTFETFITCINEERWPDLAHVVAFPLILNEEHIRDPTAFAEWIHDATAAAVADQDEDDYFSNNGGEDALQNNRLHIELDATTVDERTGLLGGRTLSVLRPRREDGNGKGKMSSRFTGQYIAYMEEGKVAKLDTIVGDIVKDEKGETSSATSPYDAAADLIRTYSAAAANTTTTTLSADELEATYHAYIGSINARTITIDLPRFCHDHVTRNGQRLPLLLLSSKGKDGDGDYNSLMQDAIDAVPDIMFCLDTLVADPDAQRVVARIRFVGTPVKPWAGAQPTGRSVCFYEYVTYAFRDGKIDRVWSIVDLESYRWQLLHA